MLAPQSGQTRVRIAEIKHEFGFVTTASEPIMSLSAVAVLPRRMHRTLSGGRGRVLGRAPESASVVCNVALSFRIMSTSPLPALDSIAGQRDTLPRSQVTSLPFAKLIWTV